MTRGSSSRLLMAGASAFALATGTSVAPAYADSYMAGDIHNHTTCNDGGYSVQTMVTAALSTFGLDWLGDSGHGGTFTRDCRYDDPFRNAGTLFENTIGLSAFKGDVNFSSANSPDGLSHRSMWEWQIIQDYHYPEDARLAKALGKTMLYIGTEQVVPGHEHADTTVIFGQRTFSTNKNVGDAVAAAEYEYRFDRADTDMSGGAPDHNWAGKVANATGVGLGTANHNNKAIPGVAWEQANYPTTSYFIPTHVERAGVFNPNGNNGYNIEHLRDFNNAGPTVAFGFETMPGHQAANSRGEYQLNFCGPGCNSVGVTTYGGVGIMGQIGQVWDALLGEGRNYFFYGSSDFHVRGMFANPDRRTTADFFPGEYQKLYIPQPKAGPMRPQTALNGLRFGNSFTVLGDLITADFTMEARVVGSPAPPKKMGETLQVRAGRDIEITLIVTLPSGPNNSPYTFDNPSLAQIGMHQPLNQPVLDHFDFIGGNVTGVVPPGDPNYTNPTNPSAQLLASFGSATATPWTVNGQQRSVKFIIHNVQNDQYVRVRGTNLPVATPNETDAQGNPLSDAPRSSAVIPCNDPACPAHLPIIGGIKRSTNDVAAWADLWFYSNPIFIRLLGHPQFLVEKNAELAKELADAQ